ncbi:unnamed protein product [Chrysoparadoxa australica]
MPTATGDERAGIDLYFLEEDGNTFKATVFHRPYFFVGLSHERYLQDTATSLTRKFEGTGMTVTVASKEDLDLANHLSGKLHRFLKLSFASVADLMEVRRVLLPAVNKNRERARKQDTYHHHQPSDAQLDDFMDALVDIREYDVPYLMRVCIDLEIRVGSWYSVNPRGGEEGGVTVIHLKDKIVKAEPKVLAFDIECTKAPLKFPNSELDEVFMISYMFDGQGYLIVSRSVVSQDIDDFEYTPKPAYPGPFVVFNEENEQALLERFFSHVQELRPQIFVTYNGDFFDWPFIERRAQLHGMDMAASLGVAESQGSGEYRGRCSVHMDAFYWVKRDSYLPQGAQGLKTVTKYKLGYDPVEVDPEDMVKFASEQPAVMASYSVSDAVATFYLYQVYVHLFVFSLGTIIPLGSEDVLRKGSGTLCEALLMVEAFRGNIICPNKHQDPLIKFEDGHLLLSETYIGGHVECLETGVFRSDLPEKFQLVPSALQGLIDNIDRDLAFAIEVESGVSRGEVTNYDEVRNAVVEQLELLRDSPVRDEEPTIYHLDVAAMYPNIILSNRLQPSAIVNQTVCASCSFNVKESNCKRPLEWSWRGEASPATRSEFEGVRMQLSYETFEGQPFSELSELDQATKVKERLKDYCSKVYRKTKDTKHKDRVDTVCMRENSFYVNTVRAFRDRRYDYKIQTKKWKKEKARAEKAADAVGRKDAEDKELLFDSLQLAHKCILNSFYGYVMRKGARWRSMEMAGIVTKTGANLITQARELVEQIGRPLELDTDGIWCILPGSFPDNFSFSTADGGRIPISYPCVMLNADVHERYTNHQYQELVDPVSQRYTTKSECSIFFEVDGPYRCMVLPSSTEEGKLLKKRYAVFNFDGSLAELKGFELKRRGELEVIKIFQSQSTSLTTARRLADFLGSEMVQDKGLNCRLVISNRPHGAPVTERAIPTAIFAAEPAVMHAYLRKWLRDPSLVDFDVRSLLDWGYYKERLGKCIQKIITIPAAMQRVKNPVPRVPHPEWLQKKVRELNDGRCQLKIDAMFSLANAGGVTQQRVDIEDLGASVSMASLSLGPVARVKKRVRQAGEAPGPEAQHAEIGQGEARNANAGAGADAAAAELPESSPSLDEDFAGWLQHQKRVWQRCIQNLSFSLRCCLRLSAGKKRNQDGGHDTGKRLKLKSSVNIGNGGLEGYLKSARDAVLSGVWQVLEIRETATPGQMDVWAMTGPKDLQKISMQVPRVFYINSTAKASDRGQKRVMRTLPHKGISGNLTEVTMPERKFRESEKSVASLLSDPDVEGIYELGTPLLFRAVVHMGCVARVASHSRAPLSGEHKLELKDMESLAPAHPYLPPDTTGLKYAFLYQSGTKQRHMVALIFTQSPSASTGTSTSSLGEDAQSPIKSQAQVWVVSPGRGVTQEQRPPLQRDFDRFNSVDGSTCSFKVAFASTLDEAWGEVDAALQEYGRHRNGPTVVVAQATLVPTVLRAALPALANFPIVSMPSNAEDSRYPALSWQTFAGQRMVQRFLLLPAWLSDRLQCARYARIPLGNISADALCSMADVYLARILHHNRHLLWCSESAQPDLGGAEGDENALWAEELESPKIVHPGAYRGISIELDVLGLSVNSVVASVHLEALEGSAGVGALGAAGSDGSLTASEGMGSTFRILKALVTNWLGDVSRSGNPHADALLVHFYRWLAARQSLMHDPALHRLVHSLMHKVFTRFVGELQRLGARVIYADFTKVIVATERTDLASAKEYADFVVRTLTSRDLFACLQVEPRVYWEQLLLMDAENYGGIRIDDEQGEEGEAFGDADANAAGQSENVTRGEEEEEEEEEVFDDSDGSGKMAPEGAGAVNKPERTLDQDDGSGSDEEDGQTEREGQQRSDPGSRPPIISHWNISEYLPAAVKQYFLVLVGEFLYRPREKALLLQQQHGKMVESLKSQLPDPAAHAVPSTSSAEAVQQLLRNEEESMVQFMKQLVSSHITARVLDMVPKIIKFAGTGEEVFPKQAGSWRTLTNPALEFVKSLCHVLSLDSTVTAEVEVMRAQALAELKIRRFNEESVFSNPCASFILPDVICEFCNLCRDLDLCRDPGIIGDDPEERWRCSQCQSRYDTDLIELSLVDLVHRRSTRFQLQDTYCGTCQTVASRAMLETCVCGGELVPTESRHNHGKQIMLLKQIAVFHGFKWLEQTCSTY